MKNLKFRVWDKIEKRFLPQDRTCFVSKNWMYSLGSICAGGKEVENLVIQQFTGLKDSVGQEIYEGDILDVACYTYSDHSLEPTGTKIHILLCYYKETDARFLLKDITSGYGNFDFHDGMTERIGIIGNIFEHPQLLEVNKNE